MSAYSIPIFFLFFFAKLDTIDGKLSLFGDLLNGVGIQTPVVNSHYLLVGERLTVQCDISKTKQANGVTSYQMSFKRVTVGASPKPDMARSHCFDERYISHPTPTRGILNTTVSVDMAGVYYCYDKSGCDQGVIGFTGDIYVEYAPREVTDFSCLVRDFEEMKCTWKDAVTYVNANDIRVDLKFRDPTQQIFQPCPKPTNHSCIWNPLINFDDAYIITVAVTNVRKNVSVESTFRENLNGIVKLSPVKELIATSSLDKPGCVHLEWNHPLKRWNKMYRVKVKRLSEGDGKVEEFKILVNNLTEKAYDACGFPAFSRLDFSVDVYPGGIFSGHWSSPEYYSARTPQEAPGSGPVIAIGSFVVVNKPSDAKDYQIKLYWNEVPESERNGIIDTYRFKSSDGTQRNVSSHLSTVMMSVDTTSPFTISVDAHNQAGFSHKPSTWHINPLNMKVPEQIQSSFVAKIVNGDLSLFWNTTVDGNVGNYNVTVYWCHGSSPIGNCQKPLNWRHVEDATASQYTVPRLAHNTYKDYSYGISVAKPNSVDSSGIFWTQCLSRFAKPTPFKFTSDALVSAVRVSWERHVCSYQSGFLLRHFLIKWCIKSECKDSSAVKSEIIPPSNNTFLIKKLKAGGDYRVTMETISDDGQKEQAQWVDIVPLKEKSKTDYLLIIGIVLGVIVVLVVGITLASLAKHVCDQQKKVSEVFKSINAARPPPAQHDSRESIQTPSPSYDGTGTENSSACTVTTLIDGNDQGVRIADGNRVPLVPSAPCPTLPGYSTKPKPIVGDRWGASDGLQAGYTACVGFGANSETGLEAYSNKAFQTSDNGQQISDENSPYVQNPNSPASHQSADDTPYVQNPNGPTYSQFADNTPHVQSPNSADNTPYVQNPNGPKYRQFADNTPYVQNPISDENTPYVQNPNGPTYRQQYDNTPYVQNPSSPMYDRNDDDIPDVQDQNDWSTYYQMALTNSSVGTMSSCSRPSRESDEDDLNYYKHQNTTHTSEVRDIELCVVPCNSQHDIPNLAVGGLTNVPRDLETQTQQNEVDRINDDHVTTNDSPVLNITDDINIMLNYNPSNVVSSYNAHEHTRTGLHDDSTTLASPDANITFATKAHDRLQDTQGALSPVFTKHPACYGHELNKSTRDMNSSRGSNSSLSHSSDQNYSKVSCLEDGLSMSGNDNKDFPPDEPKEIVNTPHVTCTINGIVLSLPSSLADDDCADTSSYNIEMSTLSMTNHGQLNNQSPLGIDPSNIHELTAETNAIVGSSDDYVQL